MEGKLELKLPAEPGSVAEARAKVCGALEPHLADGASETLKLLVSEVVTNAVKHGDGARSVELHAHWNGEVCIEVSDHGVMTTFCVVNIPVIGRDLELPYVASSVALDGADISIFALIKGVKPADARMGMRVRAVWKPDAERTGSHDDILYFEPTGEPDVDPDSFLHRL